MCFIRMLLLVVSPHPRPLSKGEEREKQRRSIDEMFRKVNRFVQG